MRSTLLEMLTYARPMGSRAELKFRRRYLLNLPGAQLDTYGNIHVSVGESRVLWSCHTDTVHSRQGRQRVEVSGTIAHLPIVGHHSSCLGADDTTGVYLMREMILAGVWGYYVFHYGEERGGIGSKALAQGQGAWLGRTFDAAIALDRQDTGDVITHQFGGRCCSDAFAWSLGEAISAVDSGLTYTPAHGVYTDTAEYAELIPECTNLSVGYAGQHTRHEIVDLRHVDRLLGVLCDLDTSRLLIQRDPRLSDPDEDRRVLAWEDQWGSQWDTYDEEDDEPLGEPVGADRERQQATIDLLQRLARDQFNARQRRN